MAIDYTLNWSDDVLKTPFTLLGGSVDTTSTSLALTGKGYVNWGERLQENLLHLLENFASGGTPPANPTDGQTWYNDVTKKLSVYHTGAWHVIASQGTTASLGGEYYPVALDQIIPTDYSVITLAQFTCPTTGYISVLAGVGLVSVSTAGITLPVVGGPIISLYKNTTLVANLGMNGAQQPVGTGGNFGDPGFVSTQGPVSHGMQVGNPYLQVNAGDNIYLKCVLFMVNPPSAYKTAEAEVGSTENFLAYHYI